MTTLNKKFQEITKRLQQLTVWRPNDRDPFDELDRWRTEAHTTIEQVYLKKKQQIEQVIDKHEREFMRQIARQRMLLNSIRRRLVPSKEINSYNRTSDDSSISTDLQRIENDINTKLGRGEVILETRTLNYEESVMVGLKTYLSATPSMYYKEMAKSNQPKKAIHRSTEEVKHAFNTWKQTKDNEEMITTQKELENARQYKQYTTEHRLSRLRESEKAYKNWLKRKMAEDEFNKKKSSIIDNDTKQETNGT